MKKKKEKVKVLLEDSSLLNLPGFHSTAAVSINLTISSYEEHSPAVGGDLHISDCSRAINLDLYASDLKNYDNGIFKLTSLELLISKARQALEDNREYFKKKLKEYKKRLKKEENAKSTKKSAKPNSESPAPNS